MNSPVTALTDAQRVIMRVLREEEKRLETLSHTARSYEARERAMRVPGTAVFEAAECAAAIRLSMMPWRVRAARVASGEASPAGRR